MIQIPTLTTDRLILRPFREEDLDAYAEICADAEVMRYLGTGCRPSVHPQDHLWSKRRPSDHTLSRPRCRRSHNRM